jgi:integrase
MSACGLGAAEVLRLELSDVDWEARRLHVVRCKTGTPLWLPLLPEIARALADYIRYARPRPTTARQIFLSQQMPFRALTGSGALRHRVNVLARRAGLKEHCGTHRFRHSHATRQVEIGTDMKTLADILGHRDAETTSLYTRGAVQRLRRLALPLPK